VPKRSSHILELAQRGAEMRLRDLVHEAKLIIDLFPHLRDNIDRDELPVRFILRKGRDRAQTRPGRRRRLSAAARKAVSRRMKKYWAARRKAKKK
jgi:hypothetical protein